MASCVNGHELTSETKYVHPSGYSRCRVCHAARARVDAREKRLNTLEDRIAEQTALLDKLRVEYAAEPRSARLSEAYGEQSQIVVELRKEAKRAAQPPPVPLPPTPRFLDNGEWADLLPEVCPLCEGGGRTNMIWPPCGSKGYSARIGNLGVQCSLCRGQYELEIS